MKISINLATRPYADAGPAIKRLRIVMGALAVVALGLGLGLHTFSSLADQARARNHSLDGQIARLTAERAGYQSMMRKPENAAVLDQSQRLNQLFGEKSFSWTLAMEDLETMLPAGVQATTLEPLRKNGVTTLHMRVAGPRDRAIELVANLEKSRRFSGPRIVGESSETTTRANQPLEPVSASNRVSLDLLAEYKPAAPGERKLEKPAPSAEDSTAGPSAAPSIGRTPYTGLPRPTTPPRQPRRPGGAR